MPPWQRDVGYWKYSSSKHGEHYWTISGVAQICVFPDRLNGGFGLMRITAGGLTSGCGAILEELAARAITYMQDHPFEKEAELATLAA